MDMGLFGNHEFHNLEDLFFQQLEDVYDAEKRLTSALPKMAEAARNPELKNAFRQHTEETKRQAERLEQVFRKLNRSASRETCEAMKGLISEGEDMLDAKGDEDVRDAAIIAAAQRVEHYEIAAYGTLRTIARELGFHDLAETLQQTLDEEKEADSKLTAIAENRVNVSARR